MKTVITGGRIVTEQEVLTGYDLLIEDGRIKKIAVNGEITGNPGEIIDVQGSFVMPGIIDIHSDMIENYIQPRSTAVMDFEFGLREAEKTLAMCGITTIFHSISMFRDGTWDVKEIRKAPQVRRLAKLIKDHEKKRHLIHNRYHLRYEIDNLSCYDEVKEMIEEGDVDLLSFMDHSPGQGQYQDLDIYRRHLPGEGDNLTEEEFAALVKQESEKKTVSFQRLKELSDLAGEYKISVASHDDDSLSKLSLNQKLGVKISEFPITLDVAREAADRGLLTVLGAPNILLGGSHSGNLSALDAIRAGAASVLVSDYYPQSLLQAVFYLYGTSETTLVDAVRLVSLNPAKAAGIDHITGSIAEGKLADLLIISEEEKVPELRAVFAEGKKIIDCHYRPGN